MCVLEYVLEFRCPVAIFIDLLQNWHKKLEQYLVLKTVSQFFNPFFFCSRDI
jgi:hypothetical protein